MKEQVKIFLIYISRFLLSFFRLFPIKKNQILFISFSGKNFTCNPKYIYNELIRQNCTYKYIWVLNNLNEKPEKSIVVKYKTFSFYYYLFTSKLIISNYTLSPKFPIRKKQILINTWHGGGAYKKVGLTNNTSEKKRVSRVFDILSKETSYFFSSCKKQTKSINQTFKIPINNILEIGYPRNDIFFNKQIEFNEIKKRICEELKIPFDKKILLFAPTYKGQPGYGISKENIELNINQICSALSEKFSAEFICIYRGHYYVNSTIPENCFDGCKYPDMQELLFICDVLITDYSSSIWDFSFTKKPCFLYTPDLQQYSTTQEFYEPIDKWGFSYSLTEEKLLQNIKSFNQLEYSNNLDSAHTYFSAFDKGASSTESVSIIKRLMEK